MDRIMKPAVLLAAGLALGGCGGSGSGSESRPVYEGYDKIILGGEEVRAEGRARTATGEGDAATELSDARIVFKVGRESKSDVARIAVEASGAPIEFDRARVGTISQNGLIAYFVDDKHGVIAATGQDGQTAGFFAAPGGNDLEYMTFGSWMRTGGPDRAARGAGAFGVETLAADIPNVGSANYNGATAGTYVDENGREYTTRSKFIAAANFRTGEITLGTNSAEMRDMALLTEDPVEAGFLNFVGTGTIEGRTRIEADVSAGGGLRGDLDGRFYGPDGKEIGGTFEMRGAAGTYVGAFGAEGGRLDPAAKPKNPGAGSPETGRDFINNLNVGVNGQ